MASVGGVLALSDGARITIPPGALQTTIRASLDETGIPPALPAFAAPIGKTIRVDLKGQSLAQPATLELPYDPGRLPQGTDDASAFAAYFDESMQKWVPVGGVADPQRHVVVVQINHASWWGPWTWITDTVLQGIITAFKLDFGSIVDAATAFRGCLDSSDAVIIDESGANDYLGSCVELNDKVHPRLRIVNRRTFDIDVHALLGNASSNLPNPGEPLGRLERRSFTVDFSNAPVSEPLTVRAEVDWLATLGHAYLDILGLIPGLNVSVVGDKILLKLYQNQHFLTAAQLIAAGDKAGFNEEFARAIGNADIVNTVGDLMGYGGQSLFVIFKALSGVGIGLQIADAANSAHIGPGEVKFYSNRPIVTKTTPSAACPISDATFCDFVRELEPIIRSGDATKLLQRAIACPVLGALQGGGGAVCDGQGFLDYRFTHEVTAPRIVRGLVYPYVRNPCCNQLDELKGPAIIVSSSGPIVPDASARVAPRDVIIYTERQGGEWIVTAILVTARPVPELQIPASDVISWP